MSKYKKENKTSQTTSKVSKSYRVKCRDYDEFGRGIVHFNGSDIPVKGLIEQEYAWIHLKHTGQGTIGILDRNETPSAMRVKPACPVYERCGGCQLMHMNYEAQLKFKQTQIEKLFSSYCSVNPIKGMENPTHYRNKIHTTFSFDRNHKIIAGIYEENSHRVVRIDGCMIQDPRANEIISAIVDIMDVQHLEPYDEDRHSGTLRHVLIRTAPGTGQILVVPVIGQDRFPGKNNFVQALTAACPQITSIVINYNHRKTSMVLGEREEIAYGPGYIVDTLCGLSFKLSPKSFYQVNSIQTQTLYDAAFELADIRDDEHILDAYCGIGTITLSAAKRAREVVGVEINPQAIANAGANAVLNHIANASFICDDAGKYMSSASKAGAYFDTVIVDPPRNGLDQAFISSLVKMKPKKVVYISCNPQTQILDVTELMKHGYDIRAVQPVDMFGNSYHIENIVLMTSVSNEAHRH